MDHDTRVEMFMRVLRELHPDELISTATLCQRAKLSQRRAIVYTTLCDYRFRPYRYGNNKWGRVTPNGIAEEIQLRELDRLRRERKMLCDCLGIAVDDIPRFLRERNIGVGLPDQRTQRGDIPCEVVNGDNHTDNQLGNSGHND